MAISFYTHHYRNLSSGEFQTQYRYAKLQYTLALRFAVIIETNRFDMAVQNAEPIDIPTDRNNVAFKGTLQVNGRSFDNTVVIANPKKSGGYNIVTLWLHSDVFPESEKGGAHIFAECVSKGLDVCSPSHVAQFSAAYRNGSKGSAEIFQEWNKEQGRAEVSKDFQLIIEEEKRRYADQNKELADAVAKVEQQQATILDMDAELKRLKAEAASAHQDKGQRLSVAAAGKLAEVTEHVPFGKGFCTVLRFENGAKKYMRTDMFDRTGVVTARAKELVGQEVVTTCWDLPGSTKWKDMGYFRNIYPAGVLQ